MYEDDAAVKPYPYLRKFSGGEPGSSPRDILQDGFVSLGNIDDDFGPEPWAERAGMAKIDLNSKTQPDK